MKLRKRIVIASSTVLFGSLALGGVAQAATHGGDTGSQGSDNTADSTGTAELAVRLAEATGRDTAAAARPLG
ncbi:MULTISPECIES: hypothetical protein [unclassified Streptomyces]|uniref:hypothetical protein n=1 Tax=unclassified Streptomyces TaxID=2593676 RepID=UPI003801D538